MKDRREALQITFLSSATCKCSFLAQTCALAAVSRTLYRCERDFHGGHL